MSDVARGQCSENSILEFYLSDDYERAVEWHREVLDLVREHAGQVLPVVHQLKHLVGDHQRAALGRNRDRLGMGEVKTGS